MKQKLPCASVCSSINEVIMMITMVKLHLALGQSESKRGPGNPSDLHIQLVKVQGEGASGTTSIFCVELT